MVKLSGLDLTVPSLLRAYREGTTMPREVIGQVLDACDAGDPRIWISRMSREAVMAYVDRLEEKSPDTMPLFGVPFAIKDNIDLQGLPTTAGCPEFAYEPGNHAVAVEKLIAAGAIPIGKTNLDQFATGLVGVRSPYGHPENPFHPDYIPGGSSSGSAVAVSTGLVSFSLGTDTAGSGRVPAALNQLVGLKPTCGLVSARGVVPACRSLDCVTVFAQTVAEAAAVLDVMAGFDPEDAYSRQWETPPMPVPKSPKVRVGVPAASQLEFFGDDESADAFRKAMERGRQTLGWEIREIDFGPFLEAARLLYEGPWVAERLAAIEPFLEANADAVFPVTRRIIEGGRTLGAVGAFRAAYRLRALKQSADRAWEEVDAILTPTIGRPYTVAEVEADPVGLNSK
ncbi:MAG: allophanate hydrolase, partial [Verrucomicrobiae bacterium]|nr:allophanate hydrolase [Verrucomicrobiae bacterium]